MDHYENFPIKLIQLCNVHCHLRGFELDAIIYLTANFFIHFTTLDDREAVLDNSCVCYLPYCGSRNMLRDELWDGEGGGVRLGGGVVCSTLNQGRWQVQAIGFIIMIVLSLYLLF